MWWFAKNEKFKSDLQLQITYIFIGTLKQLVWHLDFTFPTNGKVIRHTAKKIADGYFELLEKIKIKLKYFRILSKLYYE